jgi:hypothetical protein
MKLQRDAHGNCGNPDLNGSRQRTFPTCHPGWPLGLMRSRADCGYSRACRRSYLGKLAEKRAGRGVHRLSSTALICLRALFPHTPAPAIQQALDQHRRAAIKRAALFIPRDLHPGPRANERGAHSTNRCASSAHRSVLSYLSGKVGSEKSSAITGLNGGRTRDRTLDLSRVMATPTVIKSACYRGFAVFSAVFSTLSPAWDVDLWSLRQEVIQNLTFPKSTQLEAKRVVASASGDAGPAKLMYPECRATI